jgi:hypothetical protein
MDLEGSGSDQFDVLWRYLPEGNEKNHEQPPSVWSVPKKEIRTRIPS